MPADPLMILKTHVDNFDPETAVLTFVFNEVVKIIFERAGTPVETKYLLDDSLMPLSAMWVLRSRTARPHVVMPPSEPSSPTQGATSVLTRAESGGGDTEKAAGDLCEILVPTCSISKWFADPTADGAATDEEFTRGIAQGEEEQLARLYRGAPFETATASHEVDTRHVSTERIHDSFATATPETLFSVFLISAFKAMKERIEVFAIARNCHGNVVKRYMAARRVRRLAALSEEQLESFLKRDSRDGMNSLFASLTSLDQLDATLPTNPFASNPETLRASEDALARVVKDTCNDRINAFYGILTRYYYAALMCKGEPEHPAYSTFYSPTGMLHCMKHAAAFVGAMDRYPFLPEDELLSYARRRQDQFEALEVLWAAVAEGDLEKILTREVTLNDMPNRGDSSSSESDEGEEGEVEGVEGENDGGGVTSTAAMRRRAEAVSAERGDCRDGSIREPQRTQSPDSSCVRNATALELADGGATERHHVNKTLGVTRDVEIAVAMGRAPAEAITGAEETGKKDEALSREGATRVMRATALAAMQVDVTGSPHQLLKSLQYCPVPEDSALAKVVEETVKRLRRRRAGGDGKEKCEQGIDESDEPAESEVARAVRSSILQSLVYPRETLPERSNVDDVVQRVTPFTPLDEVAFILECLDARGPCTNAHRTREYGASLAELTEAIPMHKQRRTRRQLIDDALVDSALSTGRPDEGIITFLRTNRVLRLEFCNPMPVAMDATTGVVCDCCGLIHLNQGFQACTYEDVRNEVSFYDFCMGYDMCTPCAVYFVKRAFSRLSRALYPLQAPPSLPTHSSQRAVWRNGFYSAFAHGSGGSRAVMWSLVAGPAPARAREGDRRGSESVGDRNGEEEERAAQVCLMVSVCPYAAQPVAWIITETQQAAMREAFAAPTALGSDDALAGESLDYLHITPQRRAALPVPPLSWRRHCRVVACVADKNQDPFGRAGEDAAKTAFNGGRGRMFTETDTCPVCLGRLASASPTMRTTCGHWFHVACLEQLPGSHQRGADGVSRAGGGGGSQNNAENDEHWGYEDFLSDVGATATSSSRHDNDGDDEAGERTDGSAESSDAAERAAAEDDYEGAGSGGACCPICRCKDFMPSMRMQDVLDRNTYQLTLRVPFSSTTPMAVSPEEKGEEGAGPTRSCTIALASLISNDGHFHNYTNVASCQQLTVTIPETAFCAGDQEDEEKRKAKAAAVPPVLVAYEEQRPSGKGKKASKKTM